MSVTTLVKSGLQWNPSTPDTIGTTVSVLISGVDLSTILYVFVAKPSVRISGVRDFTVYIFPITLVGVIAKRWKVLRERYTKEHKKLKKPTGTVRDEVERVWELYHLMDFLKDFVRHRRLVHVF